MQLFQEFKPISKAEWLAKIEKDLKGKPMSDLLVDFGEITAEAFHHLTDRKSDPMPLPIGQGWEIGEDVKVSNDIKASNGRLLNALECGVNAPRIVLEKNISAENLAVLLEGVRLGLVSTHFYLTNKKPRPQSLLPLFLKYIESKGLKAQEAKASINCDDADGVDEEGMRLLLDELSNTGKGVKALTVNGKNYFNEEKPILELVGLISEGERLLHQYSSERHTPAFIHQHIQFSVFIGKNYFLQIAKLRALRLLWANIMKAYEISDEQAPIEGHLSPDSQSEDANTNMIAATTQAMSAIIGGVDRLTVLPSDAFSGEANAFSQRIARNVQHVLQMESYFDRVDDPAAGSYFVENLTAGLAEKAWEAFCRK